VCALRRGREGGGHPDSYPQDVQFLKTFTTQPVFIDNPPPPPAETGCSAGSCAFQEVLTQLLSFKADIDCPACTCQSKDHHALNTRLSPWNLYACTSLHHANRHHHMLPSQRYSMPQSTCACSLHLNPLAPLALIRDKGAGKGCDV